MGRGFRGITRKRLALGVVILAAVAWAAGKFVVVPRAKEQLGEMKMSANEASALLTVRVIGLAELEHHVAYPETGFSCSLEELRLPDDMTRGHRNGYVFAISGCEGKTVDGREIHTGYRVTAVPEETGQTGRREFCADEGSAVAVDPAGGLSCLE